MHQTFYISPDEEISSIVDRLRKSVAADNYFVIPPRALMLQSAVNLKLLAREAEKIKKKVILVTQDETGIALAERAGIMVRASLEGLEPQKGEQVSVQQEKRQEIGVIQKRTDARIEDNQGVLQKKSRLASIGSTDFYGETKNSPVSIEESFKASIAASGGEAVMPAKKVSKQNIPVTQSAQHTLGPNSRPVQKTGDIRVPTYYQSAVAERPALAPASEKRIEKIFQGRGVAVRENEKKSKAVSNSNIPMGKKTKMFIGIFLLLCVLALGGVATFVLLPSAKVRVIVEDQRKKVDVAISGDQQETAVNESTKVIPIKFIERDESVTLSYDSTGVSSNSGSKSHGKVVIYNDYSDQVQTLIATTRLKSESGKIFRITKDVNVPGKNGDKPGSVEVEVVADAFGSEYDIEPTTFSIPGFEGGPKYDKFSAKSSEKMSDGEMSDSPIKAVSENDLANAKKKTEESLREKIKNAIDSDLENGYVVSDESMEITISQSSSLAKVGMEKDSFDYTAKAHVRAIAFSQNDVKKILLGEFVKSSKSQDGNDNMKIEYTGMSPDFAAKKLSVRAHGEVVEVSQFDEDVFRARILGKNDQEISQLIREFENLGNVEIELNPKFISRVPKYAQRVSVEVIHEEKQLK